jgi:glucokinase
MLRVDLLDLSGSKAKAVARPAMRGAAVGLGAAALMEKGTVTFLRPA